MYLPTSKPPPHTSQTSLTSFGTWATLVMPLAPAVATVAALDWLLTAAVLLYRDTEEGEGRLLGALSGRLVVLRCLPAFRRADTLLGTPMRTRLEDAEDGLPGNKNNVFSNVYIYIYCHLSMATLSTYKYCNICMYCSILLNN